MKTDVLQSLGDVDPAVNRPEPGRDDRERLRRAIVATPLDPDRAARRRRRMRPAVAVLVGAAVLLLGAGAVYAKTVLLQPVPKGPNPPMNVAQWRQEYETWTHRIALPPGAHWRGFRNHGAAGTSVGAGHLEAAFEALGHWASYWLTTTANGDTERTAVAEGWVERLRATIPTITDQDTANAFHSKYGTEAMAGIDTNGARDLDQAIAAAKRGDFAQLVRFAVGFTYWPAASGPRDPGQAHEVAWRLTIDGKDPGDTGNTIAVSAAQARAEGLAVLHAVGAPAGFDLSRRLFDGVPPGFDPSAFPPGALAETYQHDLGDGFRDAFEKLWVAWWDEWAAAAKAGDPRRMAAAETATRRLESLLPATLSHAGHVMVFGLAARPARHDLDILAAQARGGDLSGVETWLTFQHQYWAVRLEWADADEFRWVCGGRLYPVTWTAPADQPGSTSAAGQPSPAPATLRFERATERAWLACWRQWVAASAAGDQQGTAAAARTSQRLYDLLKRGWPAQGSTQVVLAPATLRQFSRLDARARLGDLRGIEDWLIYQVLYETEIGKMALAAGSPRS